MIVLHFPTLFTLLNDCFVIFFKPAISFFPILTLILWLWSLLCEENWSSQKISTVIASYTYQHLHQYTLFSSYLFIVTVCFCTRSHSLICSLVLSYMYIRAFALASSAVWNIFSQISTWPFLQIFVQISHSLNTLFNTLLHPSLSHPSYPGFLIFLDSMYNLLTLYQGAAIQSSITLWTVSVQPMSQEWFLHF